MRSDLVAKLEEHCRAHRRMPFAWGVNDCVSFCAAWARAATGNDFLAAFGPWTDERSAVAALEAKGFRSLADAVAAALPEIAPAAAGPGDILARAAAESPFGAAIGVSLGRVAASPGPSGLAYWPARDASRAFRLIGA